MGNIKSQSGCESLDNWQKVGQVSFVSSVSTTPTFSGRGTQIVYSPLLQAGKAYNVSIDERIDATVWKRKN